MSGETEAQESGWTVDTLKYHTDQRFGAVRDAMDDLRVMLDERYQTQTKATDAAFAAQQKAMETAFIAADKAVQTALLSAEKAVNKAEVAAERRFEATNEFRAQLSDQAQTFVGKAEFEAVERRLLDRVEDMKARLDKTEGRSQAVHQLSGVSIAAVSAVAAVVSVLATVIAHLVK